MKKQLRSVVLLWSVVIGLGAAHAGADVMGPLQHVGNTRMVFRVLAGILAAFLLLIGLPMALYAVFTSSSDWLRNIFSAICCLYGGLGRSHWSLV
jgi:hypothetical protein